MLLTMLGMVITSNVSNGQSWEIYHETDDFGDKTNETFIAHVDYGNFSNSVSIDEDLNIYVSLGDEYYSIIVFKYKTTPANFYYKITNLNIKDDAGNIHKLRVELMNSAIFIKDKKLFKKLLQTNSKLKCYLKDRNSYQISTYNFIINTDNFNEIYNEWQSINNSTNSNKLNNTNN